MNPDSDDKTLVLTEFIYSRIGELYKICNEAGAVIMEVYQNLKPHEVSYKSDYSPVTEADLQSNRILTSGLRDLDASVPVISEESPIEDYAERRKYRKVWLLDPLDGTQGFIRKTGEFAINAALILDEKVVAGIIYLPGENKMYYAVQGYGAHEYSTGEKLSVSSFRKGQPSLKMLTSKHHKDAETAEWIQNFNSPEKIAIGGSLKFIHIATGKADYYPRLSSLMEWDAAAGHILITEAGGSFTQARNDRPIHYNSAKLIHPPFIASGKILDA
jgi:3'(2'), 5'-bisphosphate nucleotidase